MADQVDEKLGPGFMHPAQFRVELAHIKEPEHPSWGNAEANGCLGSWTARTIPGVVPSRSWLKT